MSIAVVTGAGGALGRAIARRLAADGHAVAVVDIDTDAAEATRKDRSSRSSRAGPAFW